MHNTSELNGEIALAPAETRRHPSTATPPRDIPGRRAERTDRAPLRREIDAYALHAFAANGFGDAIVGRTEQHLHLSGGRRDQDAHAQAPSRFLQRIETTLLTVIAGARQMHATWKRRRQANAAYFALRELDTRTLRDLGFDRSEVSSIAAEISGNAYSTRTRVVLARRGLPR